MDSLKNSKTGASFANSSEAHRHRNDPKWISLHQRAIRPFLCRLTLRLDFDELVAHLPRCGRTGPIIYQMCMGSVGVSPSERDSREHLPRGPSLSRSSRNADTSQIDRGGINGLATGSGILCPRFRRPRSGSRPCRSNHMLDSLTGARAHIA